MLDASPQQVVRNRANNENGPPQSSAVQGFAHHLGGHEVQALARPWKRPSESSHFELRGIGEKGELRTAGLKSQRIGTSPWKSIDIIGVE